MWIEYAAYILTFIITTGLSVIGIMVSYQLYQANQKPVMQILLYQQIFLISFFVYGIWGNMVLHEIISDFNLSPDLNKRLSVFIPVLGIPFLVFSWFMLIRFAFIMNGIKITKRFSMLYFPLFFIAVFLFVFLIQKEIIILPPDSDLFIIYTLVLLNFAIHLLFIAPFIFTKKDTQIIKETGFSKKYALIYFSGMIIYSTVICNYKIFDFVSVCISILLLFAGGVILPVFIKLNGKFVPEEAVNGNINFAEFCKLYEISKREAEIILEICTGKTNKAIAEKLFITLQTVKDHNYRIYSKLGVNSRGQLASLVREKTGL